jgi:signal peptidase I
VTFTQFENNIVGKTEAVLGRLKKRRLRKAARRKRLPVVLDWIISIFVIIMLVILINMFVFQNYRIPSGSMVPTLLEGDLIFVEKTTFGPEILPGVLKLPALRSPLRGEVVSFESGRYAQDGPLLELIYRFVYFITLARVNLKMDQAGNPIVDLLIKRVVGKGGEYVREYRGRIDIRPGCEREWMEERFFFARSGRPHLPVLENGRSRGPLYLRTFALFLERMTAAVSDATNNGMVDLGRAAFDQTPDDAELRTVWLKMKLGYYVPHGCFFPMGDNRGNSIDARRYGPVNRKRIQGKALFRFFPFLRFGAIE